MNKYVFETRMEVRDYECDIEGIVNNANYLHYTEHTRHLFLKACGLSFAEMHEKGVDAVVARMNMSAGKIFYPILSLKKLNLIIKLKNCQNKSLKIFCRRILRIFGFWTKITVMNLWSF